MELLVICYDGLDRQFFEQTMSPEMTGKLYDYRSEYQDTVMSWTSIYTGLTKEEHKFGTGWYGFLENKYRINKFNCIWDDIQQSKRTVGLFNLPLTYPVFPVNGWIVGGFPSFRRKERRAYPYGINDYLEMHNHYLDFHKQSGQYPDDPREKGNIHLSFTDIHAHQRIVEMVENRLNTLDAIVNDNPVDVCMAGYSWLDHAGHLGFNINGLYSNGVVNMSIQPLIDICQPEKIIIVSDHGGYFYIIPTEATVDDEVSGTGTVTASIGMNHSKKAVLYIDGAEIERDHTLHEWDINQVIKDVLN